MSLRKLLLLFTFVFSVVIAQAGHEIGGVIITYKSLAANGNPLEYEITLYSYYSTAGLPPPTVAQLKLNSSCYPEQTIALPIVSNSAGGNLVPVNSNYCTTPVPGSSDVGMATFKKTIILPGTCADFVFSVTSGFGRFSYTNNMGSSFNNDYFYANLNNVQGPNSSPQPDVFQIIQSACTGTPLDIYNFTDPDGDSLYFSASAPLLKSGTTIQSYTFNPGYSVSNPVGSSGSYNVVPANGSVQTQLSSAGTFAIPIKYEEYSGGTLVGESIVTMLLIGSTSCYTPAFNLVSPPIPDPDSVQCGDTEIFCAASRRLVKNSITLNGSEFTVSSNVLGSYPVTSATVVNDSVIKLTLGQAIVGNDEIKVHASNGNDNDVIFSLCGQELLADEDTLTYYSNAVPVPLAGFTYNPSYLSVAFTSTGTGNLEWDFGDGSPTSNLTNPVHTYMAGGTYNVQLVATNVCGQRDTSIQSILVCGVVPTPYFSYSINGDTVEFYGSGVQVNSYGWRFGDGNTGTGDTVVHVYPSSGEYFVELIGYNQCGDSSVFTDTIKLCMAPQAFWTYNIVSSSSSGMIIDFDGTASQNATSFEWNFGDGTTDNTTLTPTHTYLTPSLTYLISLTVVNSCSTSHSHAFRLNEIGEEEFELEELWKLYPNPATESVIIEFHSSLEERIGEVYIQDYSGKNLLYLEFNAEDSMNGTLKVDVSELPGGIYLLMIKSGGKQFQGPLQIRH